MENFAVGEIVWAKIRGYPWWPAMVSKKQLSYIYLKKKYISLFKITGIVDDNKEKKFVVGFIGDNTHSVLQKKNLNKFQKEYKNFANTKKRTLLDSIRLAKEMIENKGKPEDLEKLKRGGEQRASANNFNNARNAKECK